MKFSWLNLAEEIITNLYPPSERQKMRDLYYANRDFFGRKYGLRPDDAEEVGFHAVGIHVEQRTGKLLDILRDAYSRPCGWALNARRPA